MPLRIRKGPQSLGGWRFGRVKALMDRGGIHEPPAPASCCHHPASPCLKYEGPKEGLGDSPQT